MLKGINALTRVVISSLLLAGVLFAQQRSRVLPIHPAVQVDDITPTQGPISGGTVVTISGTGLAGAAVSLDGQPVTPLSQSDTGVRLLMAPHDNGYVVIAVKTADGKVAYHRYLFVPPRLEDIPPGYITTVAGVGPFKGDFGPALEATIQSQNLAFDPQGNLYLAEPDYYEVSRITSDGVIERFAGSGANPFGGSPCCGDGGPAAQAAISFPRGVGVDGDGNVFIADQGFRIRRVDARSGIITTIGGTGIQGFTGDGGPATAARIGRPSYLVVTRDGVSFIDFHNSRIRRIGTDGRISTVAGNGTRGFSGDGGPATAASFDLTANSDDSGITADPAGNLFLLDPGNARVRRVDSQSGSISTFALMGPGALPSSIAADGDGNIYVAAGGTILKFSPSGALLKTWGRQPSDLSPDGTSLDQLRFGRVGGMTFDRTGNLVYSDGAVGRVRRMNFLTNAVETIGGQAPATLGEEGPAIGAALKLASGDVGLSQSGELFIADERVRRVNALGTITTIAGHALHVGAQMDKTNVPALNIWNGALALFVGPTDEVDTASFMSAPYHIDSRGIARQIADRNQDCGFSGDGGPAAAAKLCQPWGIARDRDGHVFIADTNNNRIRRVDVRTGTITTVAGTGPTNGFENYFPGNGSLCGDGGLAVNACLSTPYSVAFDNDDNLFIADFNNARIRRIDRLSGIITTFVLTNSVQRGVTTIRFDRAGYLYTNYGDRIVRFDRNGNLQTIAGVAGKIGFSGDGGPALQATINRAFATSSGVVVNDAGDVFFVDGGNRRVRAIRAGAILSSRN